MATTIDTYAPYDAGAGSAVAESTWRKFMRHMLASGVLVGVTNQFELFADSTGMQVKVKTGECWIRGHWGENLSQRTLTVTTSHATLPRIDRAILRNDFVNNRIELDVKAGTANASPVPPTLTQDTSIWEISLGQIRVDAAVSTIAASKITDERFFTGGDQNYGAHYWDNVGTIVSSSSSFVQATAFTVQQDAGIATMASGVLKLNRPGRWSISYRDYAYSNTTTDTGVTLLEMRSSSVGPFAPDLLLGSYAWHAASPYPQGVYQDVQFSGYINAAAAAADTTFWVRWHASAGASATVNYSVRAEYLGAR